MTAGVFFYATKFATKSEMHSIHAAFADFTDGIRSLRGNAKKNPANPQIYRGEWSKIIGF